MQFSQLGSSGLSVSRICLGTMTWGIQNTQADANEQMAKALSVGINFFDTAEMYPVPPAQDSYGDTERIIGHWLSGNADKRKDIILATKIAGPGLSYIRQGKAVDSKAIAIAVEESLRRLQTDYIDLYQVHWPNRLSPHFGNHWPGKLRFTKTDTQQQLAMMRNIVKGIKLAIDTGKIRHWGLSDETAWGISTYCRLCREENVPLPVSIQNEFSLLHAKDWPYLVETCVHEGVAFLPWSPLAGGVLSGKYADNQRPQGSRWTLVQRNGLFRDTENVHTAVAAYCDIAATLEMTPSQLALAWVNSIDGVTSTIIGATTLSQLEENIEAFSQPLPKHVLEAIHRIFLAHPVPF